MRKVNRIITHPARWFRTDGPPQGGTTDPATPPPADGQGDAGQGRGTTPPPTGNQGGQTPPAPPADQGSSPMVPKARLDEVLAERNALQSEKEERERKEAQERGDHERVAAQEKERADKADAAAKTISRRQALTEALHAEKVPNIGVALRLAIADGKLDAITVDKDYNSDPESAKAVVKELLANKEYAEAIKPTGSRSFGDEAGGRQGGSTPPEPKTAMGRLAAGFREAERR